MSLKLFSFLAVLAVLVPGCASKKPEGRPIARFGGEVITDRDFLQKAENLPREIRGAAFRRRKEFAEDLVGERFLLKEALRRKVDEQTEIKDLIEQARRKILVAKLVEMEIDSKLRFDPDEAKRYYDLHKEEFMTPLLLRASHILVKTREEAEAVKAELDAGADFEESARRKSIDTTAIRGGDLGFFQKGQFVPEFEQAVFSMNKGDIKGPVQSPFGFHLIKLTDRAEPNQRDFASVRARIEERLILEKRSNAFKEFLARLKGNTQVQIDEKALEALSPADAPPAGKQAEKAPQ